MPVQRGAAADPHRRTPVLRLDPRAHRRAAACATRSIGRRISDASPISSESNGCAGEQAHEEPHRRAGIAHVEHARAARASPRSPTPSMTHLAGRRPLHVDAEARHRPQRREAVLALEEARDAACVPEAMAPSISARCEMDLSPGTRSRPAMPAPGSTTNSGSCVRGSPADTSRARGTARPGPSASPSASASGSRRRRGPRGR